VLDIETVTAVEILDSRARPTLAVTVGLPGGLTARANATVGVSMAAAWAIALADGRPLWQSLAPPGVTPSLPVPHFNVVSGCG
jgi:enolase